MSDARLEVEKQDSVEISDESLARRAAGGDEPSFALLVHRYSSRLFSLAYRFLNDRGEAEDAIQDVFIKVYRALPKSKLDLPFKPWIYRITTNECLNRIKRRKDEVADTDEMMAGVPDSAPLPPDEVAEKELQELLMKAIRTLPDRYQPVVILRYTEGLSFREIGEVLGIPEGTAKTFFSRAKDQLKSYLSRFETR